MLPLHPDVNPRQSDTSIRLILHAYMRRTPPLCSCITNTEAFPVTEERIQSDRFHLQAETQLPRREGREAEAVGSSEMPTEEKWKGETKFPCCVFPRIPLYCKLLTEQISLVFLQRRRLSRWGVSIASLAVRHQRGLEIPPEHPSFDSFEIAAQPPLLPLPAYPDEASPHAGGSIKPFREE